MAAAAAPDPLVFNRAVNGMTTEANNMSTTVQKYAQHQQTMGQQLQLIGSQPLGPILQTLTSAVQALTEQIARLDDKVSRLDNKVSRLDDKVSRLDDKVSRLDDRVTRLEDKFDAKFCHLEAKIDNQNVVFRNSRVYESTANLLTPYSLNANVDTQVAVGNPIPNFPKTPALLMTTGRTDCRRILTALAIPWENNETVEEHRLRIREAIGLPAL